MHLITFNTQFVILKKNTGMIMRFIWPLCKLCRLIDQAFAKGVKVAVCSTSNEKAVCFIRFLTFDV